jgi:hypothetical protein
MKLRVTYALPSIRDMNMRRHTNQSQLRELSTTSDTQYTNHQWLASRKWFYHMPSQNHICDKGVAKNHTTLDNLVIYRLNIIETDFILDKTTIFEHFYQTFAFVKHAIQPCDIFPYHTVVSHG